MKNIFLIVLFFVYISSSFAKDPIIWVNQTATIGYASKNFTVYGENFEANSQNRTYCDWMNYGSHLAYFINENQVKCIVPRMASESVEVLKIANTISSSPNVFYTVYSNPIAVNIYLRNNGLMIGSISPYQPIGGQKVYVTLSQGNFLTSNASQNMAKLNNGTFSLYYVNSTNAYFYAPYTHKRSMTLSITANGGASWSNSISITFHQIDLYGMSPTTGSSSTVITLNGIFSSSTSFRMRCLFADYSNTNYNVTVRAKYVSTSEIHCTVPTMNRSTNYFVYVSEDLGYHYTMYSSSYFYYAPHSTPLLTPVISGPISYDMNAYSNSISGYYFCQSTQCLVVNSGSVTPYYGGINVTVTYSSSYQAYISFNAYNLDYLTSYQLVCTNDGTTYSAMQSINFVPSISYVNPTHGYENDKVTIFGTGFSLGNSQSPYCKLTTLDGQSDYFSLNVISWTAAEFYVPYLSTNGVSQISCSNDQSTYSSSSAQFTYDGDSTGSNNGFNIALWLPLIAVGFVFLVVGVVIRFMVRKARMNRSPQNNQTIISAPLENHQIELESIENNDMEMNSQPSSQQHIYYPVQQVNQIPMFGYPQSQPYPYLQPSPTQLYLQPSPVQVFPNNSPFPNVYPLSQQGYVQQPLSQQSFVVPQQPLSQQGFVLDDYLSNNNHQN